MCDYSLEAMQQTNAVEGEKYVFDGRIIHGFIVPMKSSRSPIVAACVKPGQQLKLSKVTVHPGYERDAGIQVPTSMTVTVVHRHQDREKYRHFGPHGDGILLPNGRAMPVAMLWSAEMEVLPVEKPKKRNLSALLGLDKKHEATLREIDRRSRVDAD